MEREDDKDRDEQRKKDLTASLAMLLLVASCASPRKFTPIEAFTAADGFIGEALKREVNLDRVRGL